MMLRLSVAALPLMICAPALAALPDPVRAMLDAAAARGQASDLDMVASLARMTNPEDVAEIDQLLAYHLAHLQTPPEEEVPAPSTEPVPVPEPEPEPARALLETAMKGSKDSEVEAIGKLAKTAYPQEAETYDAMLARYRTRRTAEKAKAALDARRKLAEARLWENWKGEGQIGANIATGNNDTRGFSAGLSLARQGLDWTAKLRAKTDYQRTNDVTSVERYLLEAEPQYQLNERTFSYGLARWEKDQILGFDQRLNISGGLGYKLINEDALSLSVKGGPAWRQTDFITGLSDKEITGLAGLDFAWQMTPTLKLTQIASTVVGAENSQTSAQTALNAKLSGALSARIAYSAEIASNPPPGVKSVDTLTRLTLVYGF
jgi:putative salt-induced outer membrane protein